MATSYRVVLITAPRGRAAESLAKGLVKAGLAACVNVVPGVVSHYAWKGKLHRDAESLLVAKTSTGRLKELERWVLRNHPYEVPEVIALPIARGSRSYLKWLAGELR